MNLNEVLINKRNMVMAKRITAYSNEEFGDKEVYVATVLKSLGSYGYELSGDIIDDMYYMKKDELISFYNEVIDIIKNVIGCKKNMKPLFADFPQSVMEAKESNLYLTQILERFGMRINGDVLLKETEKFPLVQSKQNILLNRGTQRDLGDLLKNLLTSKSSLNAYDNSIVEYLIEHFIERDEFIDLIQNIKIENREILSVASSAFFDKNSINVKKRDMFFDFAEKQYNSSTDVLRAITYLSDGDISLKENTYYKSLKRADRRIFLRLLNNINNIEEDMYRHKNKWIKVGEMLHPREYSYLRNVNLAFTKLRENIKIETFNGNIEKMIEEKDVCGLIRKLQDRPTEYARRLDSLIRLSNNDKYLISDVLCYFTEVVSEVPSTVLLSLITHFSDRDKEQEKRIFFPKGGTATIFATPNELNPLDTDICLNLVLICFNSLSERFKEKGNMGKVYIEDVLKQYTIPTVQRNLSNSLKNAGRGSRLKLKDSTKFIRPFIYWKDTLDGKEDDYEEWSNRNDLDLSVLFLDESLDDKGLVTYYQVRDEKLKAYHSGDITSAQHGASEYIDLDIDHLLSEDVRYIVMLVNSYTERNFKDIPDCFSGIMERENNDTGQAYEPTTVENKSDLTTNATISLVNIIDLKERENIWCDIALKQGNFDVNNISNNNNTIALNTESMLNKKYLTLYELFELHVEARGGLLVETKEEADIIFSKEEGITPFMTDVILSEYL